MSMTVGEANGRSWRAWVEVVAREVSRWESRQDVVAMIAADSTGVVAVQRPGDEAVVQRRLGWQAEVTRRRAGQPDQVCGKAVGVVPVRLAEHLAGQFAWPWRTTRVA